MDEYINKEAAYRAIMGERPEAREPSWFADKIKNIQAADVAPVVHGQWEWFEEWIPSTTEHPKECKDCGWRCRNCIRALEDMVGGYWDDSDERPQLAYCPNCGAKMDKEAPHE